MARPYVFLLKMSLDSNKAAYRYKRNIVKTDSILRQSRICIQSNFKDFFYLIFKRLNNVFLIESCMILNKDKSTFVSHIYFPCKGMTIL